MEFCDRKKQRLKKVARQKQSLLRGSGGGAMTDLSQRTGATAKGTLFKKRTN